MFRLLVIISSLQLLVIGKYSCNLVTLFNLLSISGANDIVTFNVTSTRADSLELTCSTPCAYDDIFFVVNNNRPDQSIYPQEDCIALVVAHLNISVPTDMETLNLSCCAYNSSESTYSDPYCSNITQYPENSASTIEPATTSNEVITTSTTSIINSECLLDHIN